VNLLESQFTRRGTNGKIGSNQEILRYLQHVCPLYVSLSRARHWCHELKRRQTSWH